MKPSRRTDCYGQRSICFKQATENRNDMPFKQCTSRSCMPQRIMLRCCQANLVSPPCERGSNPDKNARFVVYRFNNISAFLNIPVVGIWLIAALEAPAVADISPITIATPLTQIVTVARDWDMLLHKKLRAQSIGSIHQRGSMDEKSHVERGSGPVSRAMDCMYLFRTPGSLVHGVHRLANASSTAALSPGAILMMAALGTTKLDVESGPTRSRVRTRANSVVASMTVVSSPNTFSNPSADSTSVASVAGRDRPCATDPSG